MKQRALLFMVAAALGFAAMVIPAPAPQSKASAAIAAPEAAPAKPAPVRDGSAQALRDAFALPAGPRRQEAMRRQAEALAKLSPEEALGLVLSMPPGSARDEAATSVFVRLVKQDVAKAVAWAEKHRELALMARREIQSALATLAEKDGPAAWALLGRLRKVDHMAEVFQLAVHWADNDPRGAATFGMTLPPGSERKELMEPVLKEWAKKDCKGLVTWLRTQPRDEIARYMHIGDWSRLELDPKASWAELMSIAEVLPQEAFSGNQWANAVQTALSDPQTRAALLRSVGSVADPELRDQTWLGAVKASAASSSDEAKLYLAEIQNPKTRAVAASTIAAHLALSDPAAAIAFANSQPDDLAGDAANLSAIGTWLKSQPKAARGYIAENLTRLDVEFVDRLTTGASRDDPAEFATWALSLPSSPQQTRVLRNLSTWLHYNPDEFRAWAASQAYTPGFQNALPGLLEAAHHYYKPSSESVATVIEYMGDASARQQAAEELMPTWRATSPAEAARWHGAQVRAGRIIAIPETPLAKTSDDAEKVERAQGNEVWLSRGGRGLRVGNDTPYRTYRYNANGRSFTVFY